MKNKLKNIILYIGCFYMIVIVLLMAMTYFSMSTSIELSSNDEYKEMLNGYKDRISALENSSCKNYISNLINKIEIDVNREEINLLKYYENQNDEDALLSYYSKATNECKSITKEMMKEAQLPINFLTQPVINDEIVNKYLYQYELKFLDFKTRNYSETILIPIENNIQVFNELQIIEKLLNIITWEEEV